MPTAQASGKPLRSAQGSPVLQSRAACDLFSPDRPRSLPQGPVDSSKMKYELTLGSKTGKIASALVQMAPPGELGETLIRNGFSQPVFVLFLAQLATRIIKAGGTPEQVAEALELVSGANSSAARQALGGCAIDFPGCSDEEWAKFGGSFIGKGAERKRTCPLTVEQYWEAKGGPKTVPNISVLGLGKA